MPDILLIQPPVQDFYLTAKRTLPYGLACIAAALEQAGFSVQVLDAMAVSASRTISLPPEMAYLSAFYSEPDVSPFGLFHGYKHFGLDLDAVAAAAARSGAFLIGISALFTPFSDMALETAEAVRKACPQSFIVAGGHHATAMPGHVMACTAIDFVIQGEAETALPLLAGFFHDAKIRGVTRTDRVYEHIVSMDLTRRFLEKIGEEVPAVLSGQAESHPENRTALRTP